ncbi:acyl-CoA dehydrogenase family protein [Rhodococcus erythropolis]|nr:acyl-CoA dehydrogenase family protein [Rhodococcus erythropolis]
MAEHEFVFSAEQNDLRTNLRLFVGQQCDQQAVGKAMDSESGFDASLWSRLGEELGVLGLTVPDELGGVGAGLVEQAILAEVLGAALMPGPTFGTVALAIPALAAAGGEVAAELLPELLAGTRTAAYVAPFRGDETTVRVHDGLLEGEALYVVDGAAADVLLVVAAGPEGISLYAVEGVDTERTPQATMDLTRRQAVITFHGVPARLVVGPDRSASVIDAAAVSAAVYLSAEQVGIAQHLLDLTVDYAKNRIQFGRPIGSFQAVKHRLADMLVAVEHARSAAYHAAWSIQNGTDDPDLAIAIAQSICSDTASRVAADCIQLHGGIGFTWEHQAHLYFKRAFTDAELCGNAASHRERVAELVLDRAEPGGQLPIAGLR